MPDTALDKGEAPGHRIEEPFLRSSGKYVTPALVLGRALHPPWNEGSRVIGWNFARAVGALRPVHVMSLTRAEFAGVTQDDGEVSHVYTRAHGGAAADYSALRQLYRGLDAHLSRETVDVAHIIGLPLALAPRLRQRGVRVVAHITLAQHAYQGPIERVRAATGWRVFDRWIDAYALSSPALVGPLRARGMPESKLAVVPAAIDTSLFMPKDRRSARAKLGIPDSEPLVVYMGTLSPLRFPATRVRQALAKAAERLDVPIRFQAFAPAATHDYNRAWASEAERIMADLPNAHPHIEMSDLSSAEKSRWFQAADTVLLPFAGAVAVEPPLTLLEAMSCGAPLLISAAANQSRLVRSGENGFEYADDEELASHLLWLLRQRDETSLRLRAAARQTVLERHSMAAAASAALGLWDKLAARQSRWQ